MAVTRSQMRSKCNQGQRTSGTSSAKTLKSSQAGKKRKTNSPVVSSKSNKSSGAKSTKDVEQSVHPIMTYILDNVKSFWSGQHVIIKGLLDIIHSSYPKLTTLFTVIAFLLHLLKNWNSSAVFEVLGHARAFRVLEQKFPHESYQRTSDVKFIIDKFDRLRSQNPDKEVHVIISGGPGSGKSELARQFGQRIYERDNSYEVFGRLFDVSFAFSPVDVVMLSAQSVEELQYSLENVLGKLEGKKIGEITHTEPRQEEVVMKFVQLKEAFKERSRKPVIIFDNVQRAMYAVLYKKRSYGRFILHPGNDEYGEIRIVVTSQHRPSSEFPVIGYMYLFQGMPLNESVNMLNAISNVHNDDKNASYLAKELGGLPLSLANAALYIQSAKKHHGEFSYYYYLKEFKRDLEKYRHNIETIWKDSEDEGLTYSMTIATTSIKTIEQLVNRSDVYRDLACFVGYCDSQTISAKLFWQYTRMNPALHNFTEFDVNTFVRKSSIYNLQLYEKHSLIFTHQVTREASRVVCNIRNPNESLTNYDNYFVENSLARIVNVISTVLVVEPEASLNQIAEYTTLNFKVVDVIMSLVSHAYKKNMNLSKLITKEFCWRFLNSMTEAYLYWPNKHKSTVIMPEVRFLVNMTKDSFSEDKPELGVLLSVLYLYNTGNQEPLHLETVVELVENFARSSFENVDKTSIEKTALLLNMMGTVYRGVGQKMSKAQELHELALNISQMFGSSHEIAVSLHLLGVIHRYSKHLDIAQKYHEQAVLLGRKIYSKRNPRLGAFLLNLAVVYNRQGELKRAKITYQEALNVTKDAFGARDQRVARVLNTLATNYYSLGQYDNSVDVLLEALSIHEEIHGDHHPNVAETLYILGFTYRAKGDLESSLETLERSLKIREQYYGSQNYQVAEVLHDLSNTERQLHRLEDALVNAKRCLGIFQSSLGEKSSEFGVSLNGIGLIYLELGDLRMAKIKHEKALEIFKNLNAHGSQTASISETLKNLANVFIKLEETKKAQEYLARSLSMLQTVYESNHPRIQEISTLLKDLE